MNYFFKSTNNTAATAFTGNNMQIIEDSRQQKGKHEIKHKWFKEHGHKLTVCKLPFGDYSALNNVYVDTKKDMLEICGNVSGKSKEHERFRNECILAQSFGKHLYILVENEDGIKRLSEVPNWRNPRRFSNPRATTGLTLAKAMNTMQDRYGVTFVFCSPAHAAENIIYLLERDT